jgi:hypothetical protein
MRRLLKRGLPETLWFIVALYLLMFLQSGLPGEAVQDAPSFFLFSALIYFILGFAPGILALIRRVSRDGLGLDLRLLLLPGLLVIYIALLPYLLAVFALDLPTFGLGEGLLFSSRAAAVWLGFLVSRSFSREPDRGVTYLRPPYQL